jgi:hypothetical protein
MLEFNASTSTYLGSRGKDYLPTTQPDVCTSLRGFVGVSFSSNARTEFRDNQKYLSQG